MLRITNTYIERKNDEEANEMSKWEIGCLLIHETFAFFRQHSL